MNAWDLSCRDWHDRLKAGRLPIADLPLTSHGDRAVAVFDRLRLADVPGTPRLGPRLPTDDPDQDDRAAGEWFREIVRAMFGSYDPATRTRYIRELFALVPKKNSKTTYGALGLMLTALLLNVRPRAPFLFAAPVQDTAELAFSAVAGAIALDPVLEAKLHVRDHIKTIVHRESKATLEIITFDPRIVTGAKVCGALIDEQHVLGKMPRADKAMIQLRGGMEPFPEAFLAIITTQSDEPPAGIFKDDLQRARDVRDGKRQAPVLPVLYEFPEDMQRHQDKPWRKPENWHLVSPNLGRSVHLKGLIQACADEEAKGESQLRTWASQHLNVQIGMALHNDRWAGADYWEACGDAELTLEQILARSEVVVAGIDGGGLEDLLALSIVGREKVTGEWLSWGHAWAHPSVLERRQSEDSRLRDFARDGDLTIVENIGDDVEQVADYIEQCEQVGLLDNIGVDVAGIGAIVDAIVARGIEHERVKGVPQGWKLVGAIKTAERKLAGGALHHGNRPLMAWAVGNAKVEQRSNAIVITKQAAGYAKIDPLLALFNSVALMAMNPKPRARKHQLFFV